MSGKKLSKADETLSPVDLPEPETGRHPLVWTSIVIAVASLFLFFTNAATIHDWAIEQTPSPAQARLLALTERWVEITGELGLGTPRARAHALWKEAQAARFGDEAPDQR